MSIEKHFAKKPDMCKVVFHLPIAIHKDQTVKVVGEFNNWDWEKGILMEVKNGEYFAEVELPIDNTYQFRYLINNKVWENDWNADDYIATPFGVENSVVDTHIEEAFLGLMHFCK